MEARDLFGLLSALIAFGGGAVAVWGGVRQNRRSTSVQRDAVQSETYDELVANLRSDNTDLRARIQRCESQLEQCRTDCEKCRGQLSELAHEVYGARGPGMFRNPPTKES